MLNQVILLNEPHEQPHPTGPQRSRKQLTKFFQKTSVSVAAVCR